MQQERITSKLSEKSKEYGSGHISEQELLVAFFTYLKQLDTYHTPASIDGLFGIATRNGFTPQEAARILLQTENEQLHDLARIINNNFGEENSLDKNSEENTD